ncbi:alpha/beta hydrolase [Pseudonocardia kujensis]|uniref:alpha/beta hydrolase n=1 Tax=Pseudonocardia kujensis TaxID=1128675 RepID=UPI001E3067B2|nr:alpha/beta hydrolase [Pseudonocardia kujensis]MCE0763340.1 alpha/beta hydrolase [Pseudonocardia kujensis]
MSVSVGAVRTHEFARGLQLDVHPAPGETQGAVVYLHGGGFVSGERSMDRQRVRALAAHGVTVVVPDYRLAPAARFPDQVDDVCDAVDWVRRHLDELGVPGDRVGLWGASAGAVLAALAALSGRVAAAAVVSWFGFSDIATCFSRSPLERALLPPRGPAHALLGVDDLVAVPDLVRDASPVDHVHAEAPPFLIAHGDRDHLVDIGESRRLHEALTRAGARSTLLVLGGAGHEDPAFDEPSTIAVTAAFLRSHLHPATT